MHCSLLINAASMDVGAAHVGNFYRLQTQLMLEALPATSTVGKGGRKDEAPQGAIPGCSGLQARAMDDHSHAWS